MRLARALNHPARSAKITRQATPTELEGNFPATGKPCHWDALNITGYLS